MYDRYGSFQLNPQSLQAAQLGAFGGAPPVGVPFAGLYGQGPGFGQPIPQQLGHFGQQQQPFPQGLSGQQPSGPYAMAAQHQQLLALQQVVSQLVTQVVQALIPQIQAQVAQQLVSHGIGQTITPFAQQQQYQPFQPFAGAQNPMLQGSPLGGDGSSLRNQPVLWS
jgi:hypothetical protein